MAKASSLAPPVSGSTAEGPAAAARAVSAGRYTYTPAAAYTSPDARGTLHGDGARIELRDTRPLLDDFLTVLDAVQEEINQRWNGQGRSGRHSPHVTGTNFRE
ncbi:hypothetical protein [Streptomyces sp. NPDC091209]|uniref:hypothetical protein n=1 Tax=Streptomyces sp. NPDC091209 TaxID=3365974 RepID=UPI00382D24F5